MTFFFRTFKCSCFLSLPCRNRVPDLLSRPVLWALQHHDDTDRGWPVQLLQNLPGHHPVLGLLPHLDSAATVRLEQLWSRGSRHNLLSGLDGKDGQQHILHHLPVCLLPDRALPGYRLLLRKAAVRHQTGEATRGVDEGFQHTCRIMSKDDPSVCSEAECSEPSNLWKSSSRVLCRGKPEETILSLRNLTNVKQS